MSFDVTVKHAASDGDFNVERYEAAMHGHFSAGFPLRLTATATLQAPPSERRLQEASDGPIDEVVTLENELLLKDVTTTLGKIREQVLRAKLKSVLKRAWPSMQYEALGGALQLGADSIYHPPVFAFDYVPYDGQAERAAALDACAGAANPEACVDAYLSDDIRAETAEELLVALSMMENREAAADSAYTLAAAVASGLDVGETFVAASPGLNMTVAARTVGTLDDEPILIDDTFGAPGGYRAVLLDETPADEPVALSLFVSELGFHDPPKTAIVNGTDIPVTAGGRMLAVSLRGDITVDTNNTNNQSAVLALTLPLDAPEPPGGFCAGPPDYTLNIAGRTICEEYVECRSWDAAAEEWSSEGCRAVGAARGGSVSCECEASTLQLEGGAEGRRLAEGDGNHYIGEYIVVVVPTNFDEFLNYFSQGLQLQTMTAEAAAQCLRNPDWDSYQFVYIIVIILFIVNVFGLYAAVQRDNDELKWVETMLKSRDRGFKRSIFSPAAPTYLTAARTTAATDRPTAGGADYALPYTPREGTDPAAEAVRRDLQKSNPDLLATIPARAAPPPGVETAEAEAEATAAVIAATSRSQAEEEAAKEAAKEADLQLLASPPPSPPPSPPEEEAAKEAAYKLRLATIAQRNQREAAAQGIYIGWSKGDEFKRLYLLYKQRLLVRRWHAGVDTWYKRAWLRCKRGHTLLSAVCFRGQGSFTRAQTVQILMNSLVLEILVLCMQFDGPDDDCDVDVQLLDGSCPIEINVVSVISSGIVAALITIPGMILFAALFQWQIFVNLGKCLLCKGNFCGNAKATAKQRIVDRKEYQKEWQDIESQRLSQRESTRCDSETPSQAAACATTSASQIKLGGVGDTTTEKADGVTAGGSTRLMSVTAGGRKFCYDSLNTYLLKRSLRRCLRTYREAVGKPAKDEARRNLLWVANGWFFNWLFFGGMLIVFVMYGCHIKTLSPGDPKADEAIMLAWLWSVGQRFLINEPVIILVGVAMPALFASKVCGTVCTESCENGMEVCVETTVQFVKALRGS